MTRRLLAFRRAYAAHATGTAQPPAPHPPLNAALRRVGGRVSGFRVERVRDVAELQLAAVQLVHERTGAQHIHLARHDDNNLFSVAFKTVPADNTGIPHILEHTTLCGSKQFPVRDPFFKMMSRSVANYMNAWTASDFTMYPFATDNVQDLENLRAVYLDATFFPLLRRADFLQEGWRLEHERVGDTSSPIIFKGVVYNEMKGALSDTSSLFCTRFQQARHLTSAYHFSSGGDPLAIPDLTYEQLRHFQAACYHPSNAKGYTYGSYPLERHLEALDDVYSQFNDPPPAHETRPLHTTEHGPRRVQENCPPDPMGDLDKQTRMCVSYLCNDTSDDYETFLIKILSYLLTDGHASPMYQALIQTNMGSDFSPNTGYDTTTRTSTFSVGLQGMKQDQVERVEEIIQKVFVNAVEQGFDPQRVEAAIHQIELGLKHKTANFGMGLSHGLMSSWMHGADPFAYLEINKHLDRLRADMASNPRFLFTDRLKRYLLDNDASKLVFVMSPKEDFNTLLAAEESARLKAKLETLASPNDQAEILAQGIELSKMQDAKQDLSCLPALSLDDIPPTIKPSRFEMKQCGVAPLQWLTVPTNGITYFNAIVNYDGIPRQLQPLIPLYTAALTSVGTKSPLLSAAELDEQIRLYTGGIGAGSLVASRPDDFHGTQQGVMFSGCALDRNVDRIWHLLGAVMQSANFDDKALLKTLLLGSASSATNSLAESGHRYARMHAASTLTECAAQHELQSGIAQVDYLNNLLEADLDRLVGDMHAITKFLAGSGTPRLSVVTSADATGQQHKVIQQQCEEMQARWRPNPRVISTGGQQSIGKSSGVKTWIPLPFASSYAGMCVPAVSYTHPDSPKLQLLASLMTHHYLHREIREKNGAYGGGATYSALDGIFSWYSYRDPDPELSCRTFVDAAQWVAKGPTASDQWLSEQQLQEAKISLFGQMDAPISVRSEGMAHFKHDITDQMRQERRDRMFAVTLGDIADVAGRYLVDKATTACTTVLGGNSHSTDALADRNWTVKPMAAVK